MGHKITYLQHGMASSGHLVLTNVPARWDDPDLAWSHELPGEWDLFELGGVAKFLVIEHVMPVIIECGLTSLEFYGEYSPDMSVVQVKSRTRIIQDYHQLYLRAIQKENSH